MPENPRQELKGFKPVGLTASAGFQIGVRRTLPISREEAWTFLLSKEGLKLWLGELPGGLELSVKHSYVTVGGTYGEMRVVKLYEQLRLTWAKKEWSRLSTLQIRLLPASSGKTTISFHQENLQDAVVREEMKSKWESVLAAVESHFRVSLK